MPFNRPFIVVLLLLIVAVFSFQRWGGEGRGEVRRSRIIMGTVVEITALGEDQDALEAAVNDAFAEMSRIEGLMSPHLPGSDVARLAGPVSSLEVSPDTAAVLTLGLQVARVSGGAFDMTLGRLKELWGVETENPRVPAAGDIAEALQGTGLEALRLDGTRVEKGAVDLAVDLGGIAKGYAVDRAAAVLKNAGIERASINAGGDLRLLGDHQGRPWRIGIQHPRQDQVMLATLALADTAVVTSGDYERFFEKDGRRYHHLFDPRTGYPSAASQSVTVVADSAMLADALATAAFVLGPEAGLALLEQFPGAEGMVVGADGVPHPSPGLKERLSWP
ncbi:thiamine biosynthesis lipoprotein ApbE [Desulfuromonas versatilis]|uniref:FAD:protein FMN transferase n=1 Tax=Desulfuromonas versatilis TaxID=2802975 RepID=A0ABM8HWZ4_9BACT|nr:FAD:protein FMN transferase [Desulfuromonas versatilis]BCR06856.1 thiamine biosynthesis lipoprotein ApbE [Desulfuromonas versatilis]